MMRYSSFGTWLSRVWVAFMDESQQYGGYHEVASLAAIQQPALLVFVGDHRQTPGGLSKGRAAADNRRKLLQRPLGLRALNRAGDYLPPIRLRSVIESLWPDACQADGSELYDILSTGSDAHLGPWNITADDCPIAATLKRLLGSHALSWIDRKSGLNAAALSLLVISTSPEEFGIPECADTLEAAGLSGAHRWGLILPNSSRVSLLTYKAIVAVRYPELVMT
jgi:hypothetical protein